MNIIAIDPSLISTAVTIDNGSDEFVMFNFCREDDILAKKGYKKWYDLGKDHLQYRFIKLTKYTDYSDGEIIKLNDYDVITDNIILEIEKIIIPSNPTFVFIEGFSYSSAVGDLIDLVTFSTLLRLKLLKRITKNVTIISPSSLKLVACKLTYAPIDIGVRKEKLVFRNNVGISGGAFTKTDIFMSIVENNTFNDYWTNHCKEIVKEITTISKIPKPYEDICDSYILYQYGKSIYPH